ncbi:MAG: phosphate ABC transporter substrate-binding protein PstS [Candidatus Bathyarchaeia archaeon]
MNKTMTLAIVAIAIIVIGIVSYMYLTQPASEPSTSPSPTPTPTPTLTPTPTPQTSPTPSATPTPATTPTPTATATPTPTLTPTPTPTPGPATLNGAGATFPQPLLNAIIAHYTTQVRTNVQINYQGVGSGAGISAFTSKTVDFAASDAALTASQREAAPNALHIPETIGAIVITYNLPGVPSGLKLTGPIIADIYLGTITKWNDPAIATLNPTIQLPNQDIVKVRRSDSSGTTNWFTKYLSAVSPAWNSQVGSGTSVQWPGVTVGASGNANVAATVNQTQYAIGYIELAYALQNNMPVAAIQNPAGNFVLPSLASTTAAAESLPISGLPAGGGDWTGVSLLNTPGSQAYPIVTPTYLLVYKELNVILGMTLDKARQLVDFLWYVIHDGQQLASSLQYAPLPSNLVQLNEATIRSITFNGQSLIS